MAESIIYIAIGFIILFMTIICFYALSGLYYALCGDLIEKGRIIRQSRQNYQKIKDNE